MAWQRSNRRQPAIFTARWHPGMAFAWQQPRGGVSL